MRKSLAVVVVHIHVVNNDRREKEYELVEQEDTEHIGDDVESLQRDHSVHEQDEEEETCEPTRHVKGRHFVQDSLHSA